MKSFTRLYPVEEIELPWTQLPPKRATSAEISMVGAKGSPAYLTHSYPTKVPPEAIEPLISRFTRPGDVVLDPFCGSGMTGLAARRLGRHSYLSDLSPLACHLTFNVTHPCNPQDLLSAANHLLKSCAEAEREWYRTICSDCRGAAKLEWLLWSDTLVCPECAAPIRLWNAGFDRVKGTMPTTLECPECYASFPRNRGEVLEAGPVWANVTCLNGCLRHSRDALHLDAARAAQIDLQPIKDWVPNFAIDESREMYIRSALRRHQVRSIQDFYTRRNLAALARLWASILRWPDLRVRQALAFAFTNTAWHGTRMRRYNSRGGQRPLTGTLYIPQMSVEVNVFSVFRHKIKQLCRFYGSETASPSAVAVRTRSATNLDHIPSRTVDYVFTDPPFGSNIFYADCNFIGESWLSSLTAVTHEAVVNRSLKSSAGGKSVADYEALMAQSFTEIGRVLKPNAWATLVFQNTDEAVWEALHRSLTAAGLTIKRADTLDKTQQSHKGYKGRSGQENVAAYDMVLTLRNCATKRVATEHREPVPTSSERVADALAVLRHHLAALPRLGMSASADRQRTLPYMYSLLRKAHFNGDIGLNAGGFDRLRELCGKSLRVDTAGRWFLPMAEAHEDIATSDSPPADKMRALQPATPLRRTILPNPAR